MCGQQGVFERPAPGADFGSSCFVTDHLTSYVQSRSYRAPEVRPAPQPKHTPHHAASTIGPLEGSPAHGAVKQFESCLWRRWTRSTPVRPGEACACCAGARQVILGLPYDELIDMWSLGCILAELWTGRVLFQARSPPSNKTHTAHPPLVAWQACWGGALHRVVCFGSVAWGEGKKLPLVLLRGTELVGLGWTACAEHLLTKVVRTTHLLKPVIVIRVRAFVCRQNDSLATLLARVVGILGGIDEDMLQKAHARTHARSCSHGFCQWSRKRRGGVEAV